MAQTVQIGYTGGYAGWGTAERYPTLSSIFVNLTQRHPQMAGIPPERVSQMIQSAIQLKRGLLQPGIFLRPAFLPRTTLLPSYGAYPALSHLEI